MKMRSRLNFASAIAGVLAVGLSVCGQLLAARRLATDLAGGHPSANQDWLHVTLITPSVIFACLAISIGSYACGQSGKLMKLAIAGIALGLVTTGMNLVGFPGEMAAYHWSTSPFVDG